MPERDANDVLKLAADKLDATRSALVAALNDARPSPGWAWDILNTWDELVGLVGTLQQERDEWAQKFADLSVEHTQALRDADAAEAALAEKDAALTNMTGWHNEAQARVNELEAALAEAQAKDRMTERSLALYKETMDDEVERLTGALATTRQALADIESGALKAAQLLPFTVSTSVESDHRADHSKWAGWLLRHKVLPVARRALADTGGDTA